MKIITKLFVKCHSLRLNCFKYYSGQKCFSTNDSFYSSSDLNNRPEIIRSSELTFENLAKLDLIFENDEKLHQIIEEINVHREKRHRCPEFFKLFQFRELYDFNTKSQRVKYLKYLYILQKVKEKTRQINEEKKQLKQSQKPKFSNSDCDFSRYGLGSKTLLLSVRKRSINRFHDHRLAISSLFGNKIVIDLDYEKYMVDRELKSCASQLGYLAVANKIDRYPFDVYFCNANPMSKSIQYLKHYNPNIESYYSTIFEESYLDIFHKDDLVYLSPHAEESLKTYDPNAVYIIGGFVDTVKKDKISIQKASIEGIKSYSLPLDEHIQWKAGSKSLTINQVFEIMLTLKNTGDWKKAFESVPIRKTQDFPSDQQESTPKEALVVNS